MISEDAEKKITRDREGPVQLSIMAAITKHTDLTVDYLTRFHFRGDPTDNQIRSVKRAVKRLIESGKVQESRSRAKNGQKQYSLIIDAKNRKAGGLTVVK